MPHKRTKLWIDSSVAAASGLLGVMTLIRQDWIELIFRVEPDHGSGALEWAIAGGLLLLCFASTSLARVEWRHASTLRAMD
jgi:hypothetical protein